MKDYYEIIKEGLMKAVAAGKRKFILFPYGKQGSLTKSFLNENLGIQEEFIVDNRLSKINEKIKKLEYLTTYHFDDDCVVVITSDHKGIYYELREILYNYVPSENVCDLFECEAEINRHICIEKGKEYRLEEKNNIYKPQNCNSVFFMPYYKRDGVQQAILRTDNYFEYTNLDFVTKIWNGGIISEKIKSEIIIDAGANIGNHSLYWLKECGAYQVHAFEPVKDTYAILRENVKINTCEECLITYNIALGEGGADTAVISHYDPGNIGGTQIKIVPNGDISVKSIDELKFEEKISLMKIDVEGFELKVIKGALQTIKKNKPYIMLESWERTHVIEKIIEILTAMDYQYKRISMIDYLFYI